MAIVATYKQQPADNLDYAFDYTEFLQSGDSVASGTITVSPSGLTVTGPVVSGKQLKYWVTGGASGVKYKVTVTMRTAVGRIKQDEAIFQIKDV